MEQASGAQFTKAAHLAIHTKNFIVKRKILEARALESFLSSSQQDCTQ